jgi:hypothetical protein
LNPRARLWLASALYGGIACVWFFGTIAILLSGMAVQTEELDVIGWTVFVGAWGIPLGYKSLQLVKSSFTPEEWRIRRRAAGLSIPLLGTPLGLLVVATAIDSASLFSAAGYFLIIAIFGTLIYSIRLNNKRDESTL